MKFLRRTLPLVLALAMGLGCASAEEYVSVAQLRQQAQQGWSGGEVSIPEIDKFPVLTVVSDEVVPDNPYVLTVGAFDETVSGTFQNSVRHGKAPSRTELKNGLSLTAAQSILNDELNRLLGRSLDDYALIWTEIAEWKNMETWLLCYGQKFNGLTCFDAALTMDVRTDAYHHLIIPHWRADRTIHEDVPLAAWPAVMDSVDAFLRTKQGVEVEMIELGYLMREADKEQMIVPVWRLSWTSSGGYDECYFSAQTGEKLVWEAGYVIPEPFGWE